MAQKFSRHPVWVTQTADLVTDFTLSTIEHIMDLSEIMILTVQCLLISLYRDF
jgi:hypothetical protein